MSVRPSSLRRWSLFLLVGFTDPYNYTYSENLWWKIFKNHKRTQIQRDRQRQRHRQIASFCFLLLLLHFSKRIKDFIPPKIAPFSSPIFVSSTDQRFSLVKLCLSPWTQYFSSLKVLCFYLLSPEFFFRPPFFFSSTNKKFSFSSPFHLSSPIKQHKLHDICPLLLPFSLLLWDQIFSNLTFLVFKTRFYSLAYIILSFLFYVGPLVNTNKKQSQMSTNVCIVYFFVVK